MLFAYRTLKYKRLICFISQWGKLRPREVKCQVPGPQISECWSRVGIPGWFRPEQPRTAILAMVSLHAQGSWPQALLLSRADSISSSP